MGKRVYLDFKVPLELLGYQAYRVLMVNKEPQGLQGHLVSKEHKVSRAKEECKEGLGPPARLDR